MRDTMELIALVLLLVVGHYAIDDRQRSPWELVRGAASWFAFFGAVAALTFLPGVVVWLLRVVVVLGLYYLARWIWEQIRGAIYGPPLISRPRPRQAAEMVLNVVNFGVPSLELADLGRDEGPPPAEEERSDRRRVRRLLKRYGFEATLRAALQGEEPSLEAPEDFENKVKANVELVDRLCGRASGQDGPRASRADRQFVAGALLAYRESAVERVLRGKARPLGSRFRRSAAAKALSEGAERSPWVDLLVGAGLFEERGPRREAGRPEAPPRRNRAAHLAFMAFPPACYAAAGLRARAALLGGAWFMLAGYGLYTLLEGRPVGWVYLAVWGLVQLLSMFEVHDLCGALPARGREPG